MTTVLVSILLTALLLTTIKFGKTFSEKLSNPLKIKVKDNDDIKYGDETIVKDDSKDDDKSKDDSSNKDDDTKDDSSSKSKVKEALSEAKGAVAQTAKEAKEATKTAKNIISQIFAVLSSMFWWGLLITILYLILEFGISIYQGASEFASSSTPTSTPIPLNRIVDGDYVPDKTDGTYLFTIKHNKSYRIKVSGCDLEFLSDGQEYNEKPFKYRICSSGSIPRLNYKKFSFPNRGTFGKDAISPHQHYGMAIIVIKKNRKLLKKITIGSNLYVIDATIFPPKSKVYLYVNFDAHETVISGEWHVTVDEI